MKGKSGMRLHTIRCIMLRPLAVADPALFARSKTPVPARPAMSTASARRQRWMRKPTRSTSWTQVHPEGTHVPRPRRCSASPAAPGPAPMAKTASAVLFGELGPKVVERLPGRYAGSRPKMRAAAAARPWPAPRRDGGAAGGMDRHVAGVDLDQIVQDQHAMMTRRYRRPARRRAP